ncbi:hypothetical protein DDD_1097 [Nonlabens dokdonensis DSW-6]|uniref:Uncharacterized protein n=1 Tax=Nonlabens dokdonensis (strain DSM 17205 / KCTC 12402 / DSW-6) TaxID=592029 RepID=L7W7U1_NONDD|nr:hypothetical protein DDD_1097 [Nonlabens dokdonensis DSW-6]
MSYNYCRESICYAFKKCVFIKKPLYSFKNREAFKSSAFAKAE